MSRIAFYVNPPPTLDAYIAKAYNADTLRVDLDDPQGLSYALGLTIPSSDGNAIIAVSGSVSDEMKVRITELLTERLVSTDGDGGRAWIR